MLRLLADENFHGDIVRGLLLRLPDIDILRTQDTELAGADDPEVLAWSAENDRIILTHDERTMVPYAYERISAGAKMAGLFFFKEYFPVGPAIEQILIVNACSEQSEWTGRVVYFPLWKGDR